jgi:hypothetical protein
MITASSSPLSHDLPSPISSLLRRLLPDLPHTHSSSPDLAPPPSQTAIMFVDDLNSAGTDIFGTQSAVELLRQVDPDPDPWADLDMHRLPHKHTCARPTGTTSAMDLIAPPGYHRL